MLRNKTAKQHNFATVPRADIPRSKFKMRQTRKQAFDASELIPIMCEEVLPGDTWHHTESILARLATPIAPLMDDLDLETFYFFVPNRITWEQYWEQFITGSDDSLVIPTIKPVENGVGFAVLSGGVFDHFESPQVTTTDFELNVLPIWAYFTIWKMVPRSKPARPMDLGNLGNSQQSQFIEQGTTDWDQSCLRANKRHDYFTSSLPWPQKGDAVELPLGATAPVMTNATEIVTGAQAGMLINRASDGAAPALAGYPLVTLGTDAHQVTVGRRKQRHQHMVPIQPVRRSLNRNRRHHQRHPTGVPNKNSSKDARARIKQLLSVACVARITDFSGRNILVEVRFRSQPLLLTAAYAEPDAASPVGNLGAEMHASGVSIPYIRRNEHVHHPLVRATPTYQQGTRRHWRRSTPGLLLPVFAMLGEQPHRKFSNPPTTHRPGHMGLPGTMGRISLHAQRNHRRTAQHRRTATRLVAPLRGIQRGTCIKRRVHHRQNTRGTRQSARHRSKCAMECANHHGH